jgi:hypothetical protein
MAMEWYTIAFYFLYYYCSYYYMIGITTSIILCTGEILNGVYYDDKC